MVGVVRLLSFVAISCATEYATLCTHLPQYTQQLVRSCEYLPQFSANCHSIRNSLTSKMQETERFIEAVKKHPCIWNVFIPTYKCRKTRDVAWREIIKETSVCDVETAKDKWKKLKDAFREAINKRKKELLLGKTQKTDRPYKFQHVMEFILPVLENRSKYYRDERLNQSEESISYADEEAYESHISSHSEQDSMAFVKAESEIHEPTPVSISATRRGYKRAHSGEFLDYLMEDDQRREANSSCGHSIGQVFNELDGMDKFFLSMSETAKKLPEHLQLVVKRRVFDAVIEAEEANMRNMYSLGNDTCTEEPDVKPDIVIS